MARNIPTPKAPTLAERVTAARAARFPSLRQAVAASARTKTPVSYGTWAEIENGANDNPKMSTILGIAATLGIKPSALLEAPGGAHAVREVPVACVFQNPANPRREFDEADIDGLAASFKEFGQLQPITVRPFKAPEISGEAFEIVFGERRWRAARRAFGPKGTVKIIVREIADNDAAMLMLAENMLRVDMAPLDTADAIARATVSHSTAELVASTGKSKRWVQEMAQVGKNLCDDAREYLAKGHLKISHAVILAGIKDKGEQASLAVYATQLTEDQLRQLVAERKAKKDAPALPLPLDGTSGSNPPVKPKPSPASGSVSPGASPPPPAASPAPPAGGGTPSTAKPPALPKGTPVKPSLDWDESGALNAGAFHAVVFESLGVVKTAFSSPSWSQLCIETARHFPDSDFLHSQVGWHCDPDGEPTIGMFGQIIVMRTDGL